MNDMEWKLPQAFAESPAELLSAGYSRLLSAVLYSRGIETPADAKKFLGRGEEMLCDPFLLNDMDKAVARINRAIESGEKTAVYGDYDVDGITASCLMADYLRLRGLDCQIYIPDRIDEGYGLNSDAMSTLHENGVGLVVTVDCGITAAAEAKAAKALGMDVVITDHHECPAELPAAEAIVDPKRSDSTYPNDTLAGVGVAFKVVCALCGDLDFALDRYSDLVAVGTVADVMPVSGENRALVYTGIQKLKTSPRPGFKALLEESGAAGKPMNSATVGFSLAPRINAAGRLCRTETSVSLLLTENENTARSCAAELCDLNRQRQELETAVWEESVAMIGSEPPSGPIVLASENWHPGVVGIAASRLAEEYKLPAVIIHLDGDVGKGSCRSFGDFNLFNALGACSEYLEGFGGHAFAAGLTIKRQNIDAFRRAMAEYYRQHPPSGHQLIEPELLLPDLGILSLEDVESLAELEPCGAGNPRPLICVRGAVLENIASMGGGRHLRMRIAKGGQKLNCVFFSHSPESLGIADGGIADVCFVPQINEFRSQRSVQLLISDVRPSAMPDDCRGIIGGSYLPARGKPLERDQLAFVWRRLAGSGNDLSLKLSGIFGGGDFGMDPISLCLCIKIFEELKLLTAEVKDDAVFVRIIENASKTNLENSSLFRRFAKI